MKLMVAAFVLLLAPVVACATETYTVVETGNFFGLATQFSFTEPTILSAGDTTSITQVSGATVTEFSWSAGSVCPLSGLGLVSGANACLAYQGGGGFTDFFTAGSFLTDGTYTSLGNDMTVTISGTSSSVTPEPSAVILFVTGLVILLARKN
jgi:hypothetical protein